ncbi:MAG TPA: OB-fold domain-containing protein [Egibacteraceae bacterium]
MAEPATPTASQEVEVTPDGLVYHQVISVPYQYTAGPAQRAFLRGLAERRILGSRAGDAVLVPARPFAPDGSRTGDLVEVGDHGEVVAWTTVPRDGGPVTYGLIRLDGATTPLLHRLDVPAERLAVGLRVRARWAAEPTPSITAIDAFVLA